MNIQDFVKKYDPSNQFDVLIKSHEQIEYAWSNQFDLSSVDTEKIKNIVVSGLGGSAIGGDLVLNFCRGELKMPYWVNRNYGLPSFADGNTLVIASSYSGNTEETLASVRQALNNNCQIVCITTGGKLAEIASEYNLPAAKLLPGYHPRYALWINFFTLLKILQKLKLVPEHNNVVESAIQLLKSKAGKLRADGNEAFKLAENLVGFIPVIYSVSDFTSVIGNRLKCQFNENSKLHAFAGYLPEMNHNEIIGWETFQSKEFAAKVVNILEDDYHPQIKKRIEISSELISQSGAEIINLASSEKNYKLRIVDLIYLGDWITYYLALLRGQDPASIKNINYLKEHL